MGVGAACGTRVPALAALATCVTCGCEPAREPSTRTESLRLIGTPPTATVTIDERWIGSLADVQARGVAMPPGRHFITVSAPGYFPWDQIVDAHPDGPLVRFAFALVPVPD